VKSQHPQTVNPSVCQKSTKDVQTIIVAQNIVFHAQYGRQKTSISANFLLVEIA
jgi:hypothetical protein